MVIQGNKYAYAQKNEDKNRIYALHQATMLTIPPISRYPNLHYSRQDLVPFNTFLFLRLSTCVPLFFCVLTYITESQTASRKFDKTPVAILYFSAFADSSTALLVLFFDACWTLYIFLLFPFSWIVAVYSTSHPSVPIITSSLVALPLV